MTTWPPVPVLLNQVAPHALWVLALLLLLASLGCIVATLRTPPAGEERAARRLQPADHDDLAHVVAGEAAHRVAPGIRTQAPGELPLDEAEAAVGHSPLWAWDARFGTFASSEYFDGVRRTVGLSISPRRSISLIHCLGLRIASICLAACLLSP